MNENQYMKAMECIEISPETKYRILTKSMQAKQNKERYSMMSKKKIGLIAVTAAMILGITVFATRGIISNWYSSSSSGPDYNALPTAEQAINDASYAPILIESFGNGYVFEDGRVVENELNDEQNNSIEQFKSFDFSYEKDGDVVTLSQGKYHSEMPQGGTLISSENGTDIYFMGYTNKIVPPNYKLTEEDKKAEQNGELVFSYGSDNVMISEINAISWNVDDMHFNLMQIDGKLSIDALVQMANDIISQNK